MLGGRVQKVAGPSPSVVYFFSEFTVSALDRIEANHFALTKYY